ncbi:MAG: acyl-CoA dehydrogenase family protein, partial [Stackebrandtia sp.]
LGAALPESYGGAGLGMGGACSVLIEQGFHLAPVPVWTATVAALTLAEFGSAEQRARYLAAMVDGRSRITVALEEFGGHDVEHPKCAARTDSGRWLLSGTKAVVPAFAGAERIILSATTDSGPGLFLVDPRAAGARWESVETTARDGSGTLVLDEVPASAIGADRPSALEWVLQRARVSVAALQLGVAEAALERSAEYVCTREQFGRPLGTFQAVQHQLADNYMGIDAMRVCLWRAVAACDSDEHDVTPSRIAAWWAGDQSVKVVDTAVHVHGGVGVDTESPVHRYYLWGHHLAGVLGGGRAELSRLGAALAAGSPNRQADRTDRWRTE